MIYKVQGKGDMKKMKVERDEERGGNRSLRKCPPEMESVES